MNASNDDEVACCPDCHEEPSQSFHQRSVIRALWLSPPTPTYPRVVPRSPSTSATMAHNNSSPITQVSQTPVQSNLQPQLLSRLLLDLRGRRFEVDRDTIMNLPESVLLCLFPSGLVLSRQSIALSEGGEHEEEEDVYGVDVMVHKLCPACSSLTLGHSLTPSVSRLFSTSSRTPPIPSMDPKATQAFLPLSNISWRVQAVLRTWEAMPRKTHFCQSKQSSSYERSWNTSLSPRTFRRRPLRVVSLTTRCSVPRGDAATTL